jgi:hypothetical protein
MKRIIFSFWFVLPNMWIISSQWKSLGCILLMDVMHRYLNLGWSLYLESYKCQSLFEVMVVNSLILVLTPWRNTLWTKCPFFPFFFILCSSVTIFQYTICQVWISKRLLIGKITTNYNISYMSKMNGCHWSKEKHCLFLFISWPFNF